MIARSLPGDIKEKGLAVLVAIGGGMFLTQLVETELLAPEGTTFRVIRKYSCSSRYRAPARPGVEVQFLTGCAIKSKHMKINYLQRGKNISVFFNSDITSVRDMILEHYDETEPQGTLIFNWPCIDRFDSKKAPFDIKPYPTQPINIYDLKEIKARYNKLILLETEHSPYWIMPYLEDEWLQDVDEIWLLWLESFEYYKELLPNQWSKLKWMPLRFYNQSEHIGNSGDYDYNLGFFGQVSSSRKKYFDEIKLIDKSFYCIEGLRPNEIKDVVYNTKFILDVPHNPESDTAISQNVVRIFENICMGKHILTSASTFNYFEGLLTVMDDPVEDIRDLDWKAAMDFREKYKELTYTDEMFEKYKNDCIFRYSKLYGNPLDINDHLIYKIYGIPNPFNGKI